MCGHGLDSEIFVLILQGLVTYLWIGREYLYSPQRFTVSLAIAEDHLRIVPSRSWFPEDFSSQGVIPTASRQRHLLKITVPAILEEGMRKGDLDDQMPGLEAPLVLVWWALGLKEL